MPFLDRGLFFAKAHPHKSYEISARIRASVAPRGTYALREWLDVTDPMHPDNPKYAGSPRGFMWSQAAADLLRDEPPEE